ncbi:MAG: efflux RND transporter permease subunit [Bacteroidales bacterium]|nr:efflux RND transporter permease subunit [Bacteroidales bacterium]MCF8337703.1 efflux RND transporter permease subunit [Bacteroidales bacterium]
MKNRRFPLSDYAVNNRVTIYFFTVILTLFGIMAYQSTPKENFPEVEFPYFSINTIYPGTSPEDMENLVTRPLEKEIKSIDGIKELSSNSVQDFSMILIEFETDVDNNKAYQDVNEAIDKAKSELPDGLSQEPELLDIDPSEFPILNINMTGDMGLVKIKEYAEELQDEIEGMQAITRVDIVGALEREFEINVDLYKMQAAGVSFSQIENAVAAENLTISGGQLKMDGMERNLRVVGEFSGVKELSNILIKDGIYLKDIAKVKDDFADRESFSRLDGNDVITLNVIKKTGENLIEAVEDIRVILDDFEKESPENLEIVTTGDQSDRTRNSVSNLFNTIILGFFVVVLVLMFFMGVENALFVAVAIPLSMLIAFIAIPAMDFTMNMVVLMGFILVLGIVVDNSIVVVENIYRHFMTTPNLPIAPAAKIGSGEVAGPVFSGTLTTMAPFIPLAFWPGIFGEFMLYIPITIIVTLTASMLVAYMINPVFAVSFMKYHGNEKVTINHRRNLYIILGVAGISIISYLGNFAFVGNLLIFFLILYLMVQYVLRFLIRKFQRRVIPAFTNAYKSTLRFLLKGKRPYGVIIGTVIILIMTFAILRVSPLKVIFFPSGDPNTIHTYIKMPAGTELRTTDSVARTVEDRIFEILGKDNPDIESVMTNVAVNAGEDVFDRTTQAKLAKVSVNFVEYQYREEPHTMKYVSRFRDNVDDIPGAEITVTEEQMGPPTGKPINIEVSGEDFEKLIPITNQLKSHIKGLNIAGIEELKTDIETNTPELTVHIDRDKANKLGIQTAHLGSSLRTALNGKEISKIRKGEDEYDIRLRLQEKYRDDLESLMNMKLMLPGKQKGLKKIPLSAVADVEYTRTYGGIKRKDHERVITLYSNVLSGYNANEIVNQIDESLKQFRKDLPKGYNVQFTGEQEEQQENAQFLSSAFLVALILIIVIMVVQFNSLMKPMIIAVQILFSLIGVLLGLKIFGVTFSIMMTGMGIIAVGGIVVKNAIILIDYTDLLIDNGEERQKAIIQGGATRLTPVILTAASTILGLLPLAVGMNIDFVSLFTDLAPNIYFGGDSAAFWNPLAWTIIFGLAFATFLTLVVVPAMYSIMVKPGKLPERTAKEE